HCGTDNVLLPELIQARQQQYDYWLLAEERRRHDEQQRLYQQQALAERRAASRRTTKIVLIVVAMFLLLPVLGVAGLFALGISLGKKAVAAFEQVQDPKLNGMPALLSELRKKQDDGCERIVVPPQIRLGSAGDLLFEAESGGDCIHLLGSTAVPGAHLSVHQVNPPTPVQPSLAEAQAIDYRFCAPASGEYHFSIRSDVAKPYSAAAIACPRTVAEGRMRSKLSDEDSTGLRGARDWVREMQSKDCSVSTEPKVFQGKQTADIDAKKSGPCFNLLVLSHFSDVTLTTDFVDPDGKVIVSPNPASRVQLEYCPSRSGRHRLRITPSSNEHYAIARAECRRR
ncbi:MAG TPA: hypothetical protein VIV60_26135, partial [Polyangiaceae bacterium]